MGIYTFEVTGSGEFPINMLSRGMWPATKECAKNIVGSKLKFGRQKQFGRKQMFWR